MRQEQVRMATNREISYIEFTKGGLGSGASLPLPDLELNVFAERPDTTKRRDANNIVNQ